MATSSPCPSLGLRPNSEVPSLFPPFGPPHRSAPSSSPVSSPHRFLHVRLVVWPLLRGGAAEGQRPSGSPCTGHLIASRFSAPAWLGWLPDDEGVGDEKLGSRGSQEREAGAEESLSPFTSCWVNCASSMVQPRPGAGRGRAASAVSSWDSCPGSYLPPSLRSAVHSRGKVGSQGQSKGTAAG